MSVANGISQQSARLYFKGKDHEALYAGNLPDQYGNPQYNKFHHILYMKGKDPDRYDYIWRKMYPDRYFIYRSDGPNDWGGVYWMCYPKAKIIPGATASPTGSAFYSDGKHYYARANMWADGIAVTTEDRRLSAYMGTSLSYSRHTGGASVKGGIIEKDYNYTYHFLKMKDDATGMFGLFDHEITLETPFSDTQYPGTFSDAYGRSKYFYFYTTSSSGASTGQLRYRVFNSETETLSGIYTHAINDYVSINSTHYVNGRFLLAYTRLISEDNYRCGIIEISGNSVIRDVLLPISWRWASGISVIKYYNGVYYIYAGGTIGTYSSNITRLILYTTSNFSSFNTVEIPASVVLPHLTGEETYTLHLIGGTTDRWEGGFNGNKFPFYENSKLIEDYPDFAFFGGRWTPWTNSAICYFDNPTFQESENNFFVVSSDGMGDWGFDGQEMARKYHHMEV